MMSKKKSRRRFTAEFKSETVKLVRQSDRSMSDIARELGISAKSVGEWVRLASESESAGGVSEDEGAELKRLRKENSELRMEKEILRKATVDSIGECNIINLLPTEGDVANGSDRTAGAFCFSEGRHVEAMETGRVAQ
jgi:transposase